MNLRRITAVLSMLVLLPALALSQTQVGRIVELYGDVEIDAFGTGRFIEAFEDDVLYESSVVRTDYDSTAILDVDCEEVTVAPLTTTPIESVLERRQRGGLGALIGRLLRGISSSLSGKPNEEVAVAGGRASEYAEPDSTWSFGQDPDALYEDAVAAAQSGHFAQAAELLRLIDFPDDGSFDVEDYYIQLAFAQMQLGDFYGAMTTTFDFAYVDPSAADAALLPPRLQLLCGISAFYIGETQIAAAALDGYLSEGLGNAAGDAIRLRIALHQEAGETAAADRLRRDALRAQPGLNLSEPGAP